MPRVEQNSIPTSLHYALTDSQCSICGGQLEWEADFSNINQPKYMSQHCNQDYAIHIDAVKVQILRKTSKDKQGRENERNFMAGKEDDEPKALQMAEAIKRQKLQQKQEEE
jgi:translation elongation factor EF-Ts